MEELRNQRFEEFCTRLEESSVNEAATYLWGNSEDPAHTLAPVAERIVNPQATQLNWLKEVRDNAESYRQLYNRLDDDVSKRTLESVFRYRITWDGDELTEALPGPHLKYFDWTLLDKPRSPVYIDGGAYTGGSVVNFLKKYGDEYDSIIAFEPFPESYNELVEKCGDTKRARFIQKGLWDTMSRLVISGENQSATIISAGGEVDDKDIEIETTTLDSELDTLPDLIKMDMEGSEIKAIHGAERCIKAGVPALAICAYHLVDDLRTIPEAIINISDSYDLTLRNYKKHGSAEIVLYGNPQKH